jgi:hypothetical protein
VALAVVQVALDSGSRASTRSGTGATCATPPCSDVPTGTLTYNGFPALGDMTGATVHLAVSWVANSASADGAALVQ